ncbi:MAG: hypothetical protein P4L46_16605 [Fimbriimonas sp.]|nr:hypothetical protein [Fimbriimonas sp.]
MSTLKKTTMTLMVTGCLLLAYGCSGSQAGGGTVKSEDGAPPHAQAMGVKTQAAGGGAAKAQEVKPSAQ